MKNRIKVSPIGKIENENSKTVLRLKPGYREGLKGLAGFSHVQILWWMDGCDDPESRNILVEKDRMSMAGRNRRVCLTVAGEAKPCCSILCGNHLCGHGVGHGGAGLYRCFFRQSGNRFKTIYAQPGSGREAFYSGMVQPLAKILRRERSF